MQAVQRIEREKRMYGGKKKEEVDDPHTSAAKQKRPLRTQPLIFFGVWGIK